MTDLAEWLTQLWDGQEAVAKAAPAGPWSSHLETGSGAEDFGSVYTVREGGWAAAETVGDWYMPGAGEHIALHDPWTGDHSWPVRDTTSARPAIRRSRRLAGRVESSVSLPNTPDATGV